MRLAMDSGIYYFNYDSNLGLDSRRMHTSGTFDPQTGSINAQTRTWTLAQFAGFWGKVMNAFFNGEDVLIGHSPSHRFGVDGIAVGAHDRTDYWNDTIPFDVSIRVESLRVIHYYDDNVVWY